MPHTKFDSNQTNSSEEDVLVSVAKIEGCLIPNLVRKTFLWNVNGWTDGHRTHFMRLSRRDNLKINLREALCPWIIMTDYEIWLYVRFSDPELPTKAGPGHVQRTAGSSVVQIGSEENGNRRKANRKSNANFLLFKKLYTSENATKLWSWFIILGCTLWEYKNNVMLVRLVTKLEMETPLRGSWPNSLSVYTNMTDVKCT